MKKVLIIHKNTIEKEPPTQMVIQHLLDLGISVKLITLGVNDYWKKNFESKGVEFRDLGLGSFVDLNKRSFSKKIRTWLKYRKDVLKELSQPENQNSIIWFVDADSIAPLLFSNIFNKIDYVMHILEMYDHSSFYKYVLNKYINKSKRLIVCEENRAAIFNLWFKPKKYPVVLPNKPYKLLDDTVSHQFLKENYPDFYDNLTKNNSKIILYQGLIAPERDLSFILKAINELGEDFIPVIMGRDFGMLEHYQEICPRLVHISYIPSPQHLYITSLARIGILIYDPISLNQIFCAPNKIFEYAGYGVPMIGNNIPGLSIPFQKFGCGKVFGTNDTTEIKEIILEIDRNFEQFSQNSQILFDAVDNKTVIKKILEEF
ncbi:hypothetical protein ACM39_11210 [Chryseobacterium sp. FH2]|uniref:glycosyltransferase family 1 protein n=1 Tax=Chryseobacterium sp. FH2 TaxID=1674291 RepID=UPI00065A93B2|nr:glycosyltransferase family 1 protein [Chryseobacterium sp. FH2]KMQ67900.1 hypothetical protein ACM39_11210 [Chryseobacterium sp. FH2]